MSTNGRANANRSLPRAAEELLRSLVGVADARINLAPDGSLDFIQIVPDADPPAPQLANDVTSALIAAFGVDVGGERIRVGGDAALRQALHQTSSISSASSSESQRNEQHRAHAASLRLESAGPAGTKNVSPTSPHGNRFFESARPESAAHATPGPVGMKSATWRYFEDQILCQVTLSCGGTEHDGVASGITTPGGHFELVARAAVDAVKAARIRDYPIEYDSLNITNVGVNRCVVVAIKCWIGSSVTVRCGSALLDSDAGRCVVAAVLIAIGDSPPAPASSLVERSLNAKGIG